MVKKIEGITFLYENNRDFVKNQAKEPFSKSEILQNIRLANHYQVYQSDRTRIVFMFVYLLLFLSLASVAGVTLSGSVVGLLRMLSGSAFDIVTIVFVVLFPASGYYAYIFLKQVYGAIFSKQIDNRNMKTYDEIISHGVITVGKLEKRETWATTGIILHYKYAYMKRKTKAKYYFISNAGMGIQINSRVAVLVYQGMSFIL